MRIQNNNLQNNNLPLLQTETSEENKIIEVAQRQLVQAPAAAPTIVARLQTGVQIIGKGLMTGCQTMGSWVIPLKQEESSLDLQQELAEAVKGIGTFFIDSSEATYYCEELKTDYIQPKQSKILFSVLNNYFQQGCYKMVGILKEQIHTNPTTGKKECCDVLVLIKHQDQITYEKELKGESVRHLLTFLYRNDSKIAERIQIQERNARKALAYFADNLSGWGYENLYACCTGQQLLQCGFLEEDQDTMHAVLFFYKEKENA